LLAAIKESPADDAPRLVYADWLEEHGEPRGEFLRLQCAPARLERGDPARAPLAERERQLQKRPQPNDRGRCAGRTWGGSSGAAWWSST
jgi:uncharacterized protein (TIGR02996 family)